MKKITLNILNCGTITRIASFNNNSHDATKCMKFLNQELFNTYNGLPDNIFYFLAYTINKRECFYVDYTESKNMFHNDFKYNKIILSRIAITA